MYARRTGADAGRGRAFAQPSPRSSVH